MSFYQYAPRQVAPRECRSIGYTVDSLLLLINVIEEGLPAVIPDGRYSLAPKPVVKIIMSKPPKHDLNKQTTPSIIHLSIIPAHQSLSHLSLCQIHQKSPQKHQHHQGSDNRSLLPNTGRICHHVNTTFLLTWFH